MLVVSELSHLEPEEVVQAVEMDEFLFSHALVRELVRRFQSLLGEHSRISCLLDDLAPPAE